MKVPTGPEQLTSSWVEAALGAAGDSLRDLTIAPIVGGGIVGRIYRLRLEWRSDRSSDVRSLIAKMTNGIPEVQANPAYRAIFTREIRFYQELAADSGLLTPALYHAGFDPESGDAVLLMEDLEGAELYESGAAPLEAVEALIQAIVPLHARWWNDERLLGMDWLHSTAGFAAAWSDRMRSALPDFALWYEQHAPDLLPLVEPALDAIDSGLLEPAAAFTLTHGDLGAKNAAFRQGDVVLFDWGNVSRDSPAKELLDVAFDSFGEVPPFELCEHVASVYVGRLRAAGIEDLEADQLLDEMARRSLRGVVVPLLLLSLPGDPSHREQVALRWTSFTRQLSEPFQLERRLEEHASV